MSKFRGLLYVQSFNWRRKFDISIRTVSKCSEVWMTSKLSKRRKGAALPLQKKCLAGEVEKIPCIWDLSHPKHFNVNRTSNAWCNISSVLEKSVEECKDNWAALRYRIKVAAKRKSGDAGGSPIPEPSLSDDWEFTQVMHFLPDNTKKRKTLGSTSSIMDDVFDKVTKSQYKYKETRSSTPVIEPNVNHENLNALIESQLQRNNEKAVRQKEKYTLKFQTLYAHMDTMLSRLPQETGDRISFKMLSLIQDELIDHNFNNTQFIL